MKNAKDKNASDSEFRSWDCFSAQMKQKFGSTSSHPSPASSDTESDGDELQDSSAHEEGKKGSKQIRREC
jgi:hypothetical protein